MNNNDLRNIAFSKMFLFEAKTSENEETSGNESSEAVEGNKGESRDEEKPTQVQPLGTESSKSQGQNQEIQPLPEKVFVDPNTGYREVRRPTPYYAHPSPSEVDSTTEEGGLKNEGNWIENPKMLGKVVEESFNDAFPQLKAKSDSDFTRAFVDSASSNESPKVQKSETQSSNNTAGIYGSLNPEYDKSKKVAIFKDTKFDPKDFSFRTSPKGDQRIVLFDNETLNGSPERKSAIMNAYSELYNGKAVRDKEGNTWVLDANGEIKQVVRRIVNQPSSTTTVPSNAQDYQGSTVQPSTPSPTQQISTSPATTSSQSSTAPKATEMSEDQIHSDPNIPNWLKQARVANLNRKEFLNDKLTQNDVWDAFQNRNKDDESRKKWDKWVSWLHGVDPNDKEAFKKAKEYTEANLRGHFGRLDGDVIGRAYFDDQYQEEYKRIMQDQSLSEEEKKAKIQELENRIGKTEADATKAAQRTAMNLTKEMWPGKDEKLDAWWGRLSDDQKTGLLVGGGVGLLSFLMMMGKEEKDVVDWMLGLGLPVVSVGAGAYLGSAGQADPKAFNKNIYEAYMKERGATTQPTRLY